MKRAVSFLLIFLSTTGLALLAQSDLMIKKDLRSEWMIHAGSQFMPYTNSGEPSTIYFQLSSSVFWGDFLSIRSAFPFSVFLDGTLISEKVSHSHLRIDSLAEILKKENLVVSVHQKNGIHADLVTQIESPVLLQRQNDPVPIKRTQNGFRDFIIISSLLLTGGLLLMLMLSPKLTSDYFNLSEVFSMRESDDNLFMRIGNSSNILFSVFVSFLLGFYSLFIIPRIGNSFLIQTFVSETFWGWMLGWAIISFVILLSFVVKFLIVFLFSLLFKMSDQAGFHFFNFIRILLLVFGFLVLIVVLFSLAGNTTDLLSKFLYWVTQYVLFGWVILSFLKLVRRVSHSAIHLFSYICATEIIPLLVIMKFLYK